MRSRCRLSLVVRADFSVDGGLKQRRHECSRNPGRVARHRQFEVLCGPDIYRGGRRSLQPDPGMALSSPGYNRRNSIRSNERHQRLAALPHRAAVSLSTRERKRSLHRSKGLELLRGEADRGGCEILLKMGDRGRSRNWQHSGRTLQQPSERDLGLASRRGAGQFGQARSLDSQACPQQAGTTE